MVYILPNLDLNFIKLGEMGFAQFSIWTTTEERVRHIMENQRCRSIFSKKEIVGLFGGMKMQMVRVERIVPKVWDKIVTWTEDGRWFVLEFTSFNEVPETKPKMFFNLPEMKPTKAKYQYSNPDEIICGVKPSFKHEPTIG